jgi:hypothetical protein
MVTRENSRGAKLAKGVGEDARCSFWCKTLPPVAGKQMKADLILNDPISGTFCTPRPQPTTANEGVRSAGKDGIVLHTVLLPQ